MLVSVIIPVLNEEDSIRACINSARRSYPLDQVEIIVADGGSQDRTLSRLPHDVKVVQAHRGRGTQMNCGADVAEGEIFLFCHADSRLPDSWRSSVITALANPSVSGGAFNRRYEPAQGPILRFLNRSRSFGWWWATHGERCQFMTRAVFEDIGGFPNIPLMEDVELSRELHKRGKIEIVFPRVVTSSRRLLENGILRQGILVQWYCFRYLCLGTSAEEIARLYRSSREELADAQVVPSWPT